MKKKKNISLWNKVLIKFNKNKYYANTAVIGEEKFLQHIHNSLSNSQQMLNFKSYVQLSLYCSHVLT